MRLLIFLATLPLIASPVNSTSVQTACHWIDGLSSQPDFTLSDSGGSGTTQVVCPVNFGGPGASASSTVSGANATATAGIGIGPASAEAQAYAGFVRFWGSVTGRLNAARFFDLVGQVYR
jgi:hypothetical protein